MLSVKVDWIPILPIGDSVDQGPTLASVWAPDKNVPTWQPFDVEIVLCDCDVVSDVKDGVN